MTKEKVSLSHCHLYRPRITRFDFGLRDIFFKRPISRRHIFLSYHPLSTMAHHTLFLETTFTEIMNIKKLEIFHSTEVLTTGIYIKSFTN